MSTQNVTGQATRRQTWAIFCATRCDVRGLSLSVEVASEILDAVNAGEDVRGRLANLGADVSAAQVPAEVRNREHAALFDRAWKAGVKAATDHQPTPMTVVERANPLDDSSLVVQSWGPYSDGACGFGWVSVHPGNSSFARWLKAERGARKGYRGGVVVWIGDYGQSYERKYAHARAMAAVLREAGVNAYGEGRLD